MKTFLLLSLYVLAITSCGDPSTPPRALEYSVPTLPACINNGCQVHKEEGGHIEYIYE